MPWIFVSIAAIFMIVVSISVKVAYSKQMDIYNNGIQTSAVVSHVDSHVSDGEDLSTCYVTYTAIDGKEHESALNARGSFPIGRKMVISYLPDQYDLVVFVSQELESSEEEQ